MKNLLLAILLISSTAIATEPVGECRYFTGDVVEEPCVGYPEEWSAYYDPIWADLSPSEKEQAGLDAADQAFTAAWGSPATNVAISVCIDLTLDGSFNPQVVYVTVDGIYGPTTSMAMLCQVKYVEIPQWSGEVNGSSFTCSHAD